MSDNKIRVLRTKCNGYGICHTLFPEKIALDEWGFPIITPDFISDNLLVKAERAVKECPMKALVLEQQKREEKKNK